MSYLLLWRKKFIKNKKKENMTSSKGNTKKKTPRTYDNTPSGSEYKQKTTF
jgi:hypothetical protein